MSVLETYRAKISHNIQDVSSILAHFCRRHIVHKILHRMFARGRSALQWTDGTCSGAKIFTVERLPYEIIDRWPMGNLYIFSESGADLKLVQGEESSLKRNASKYIHE